MMVGPLLFHWLVHDIELTGYLSERLQVTAPAVSSLSSTRDLPQLLSLSEGSALLKLRLLDERLTLVVDGSVFITAQGGYADKDVGSGAMVAIDEHDVPSDPRVVFAETYARFTPIENFDITVGKRRVVWGSGTSFNPTDVINPARDPTDASLQRTGVPMVMLEAPFAGFALSALFAPATLQEVAGVPTTLMAWPDVVPQETLRNPAVFPDPRDEQLHWAAAVRGYALIADTDVNLWALLLNRYGSDARENAPGLAMSVSRVFHIHELHFEGLLQRGSDKVRVNTDCLSTTGVAADDIAAIAGCVRGGTAPLVRDRLDDEDATLRFLFGTRSMFGDGTTLTAEWLYQSDGLLQKEWDDLATLQTRVGDEARAGRLDPSTLAVEKDAAGQPARLAVTPLRRHHLILGYSRPQLFDDFTITATSITAVEDLSSILTASLQWQTTEWLQLAAWAFVPLPSLARSLDAARMKGANDVLWPGIVDGVAVGEYDAVPFSARGLLEARVWF